MRSVVVYKLGGKNAAAPDWLAVVAKCLVNNREFVALAQVAVKINIATEDFGKLGSDGIRNSRSIRCSKQ